MVSRIPLTPFDDQEVSMGTNFGIYGYLYTKKRIRSTVAAL